MAALDDAARTAVWADYQTEESRSKPRRELGLTKADLRAAVDATDDWIDANAASYNSALPTAARTTLSAKQKAALFMAVACRRFDVS